MEHSDVVTGVLLVVSEEDNGKLLVLEDGLDHVLVKDDYRWEGAAGQPPKKVLRGQLSLEGKGRLLFERRAQVAEEDDTWSLGKVVRMCTSNICDIE